MDLAVAHWIGLLLLTPVGPVPCPAQLSYVGEEPLAVTLRFPQFIAVLNRARHPAATTGCVSTSRHHFEPIRTTLLRTGAPYKP